MPSFLDLAYELRSKIYRMGLITDETIYPYFTHYPQKEGIKPLNELKEKLAVGLLGVNKQVRQEASAIFFGQNTFFISFRHPKPSSEREGCAELKNANLFSTYRRSTNQSEIFLHVGKSLVPLSKKVGPYGMFIDFSRPLPPGIAYSARYFHPFKDRTSLGSYTGMLKTMVVHESHYCWPSSCYQGVQKLFTHPRLLADWRASMQTPPSSVAPQPLTVSGGKHDPHTEKKPCPKLRFRFTGLEGIEEWFVAHRLGIGCEQCPLNKAGSIEMDNCTWEKDGLWKVSEASSDEEE